jgi:thiol-disulfide isomerase/thioredoxin
MNNKWILSVGLIAAGLIVFFFYTKYRVAPAIDLNSLSLSDLEGNPASLQSFKGKNFVLCFGASWCGPCRKELIDIQSVKETELKDVEIVVVSDEPNEKIRMFMEQTGHPFVFLKLNAPFSSIDINSIPTSYIVNSKFEVKKEKVGFIDWTDASTVQHLKKLMD